MRSRAAQIGFVLLCLTGAPAWAREDPPPTEAQRIIDAKPETSLACTTISVLADRGARSLRAADILGHDTPIDLRNDGHPAKIHRSTQGTARIPTLANETEEPVGGYRDDYVGLAWWPGEISVVRIRGRIWEIAWHAGALDDTAALIAATDGTAVCRFQVIWRPATFRLLPGGVRRGSELYRSLLLGRGQESPSAGLDAEAVQAASDLERPYTGSNVTVRPISWRLDLLNNGQPLTLIRVEFLSSAGPGCHRDMLGILEDRRATALDLFYPSLYGYNRKSVPLSQALNTLLRPIECLNIAETPVLGWDRRAYVIVGNMENHVWLLAGANYGMMQPLGRLSWTVRNQVLTPSKL